MAKLFLLMGSLFGGLGVAIGAFGAHKFAPYLKSIDRLETFETAVRYQFYHAFALIACGMLFQLFQHRLYTYAGYCFIGGIVVFSGSLYILCATNTKAWGAVTPFGGVLMIAGWLLMGWAVSQSVK
jgi:uncharacterized membrane protein YgdD (TMEM256/DUF423 family)